MKNNYYNIYYRKKTPRVGSTEKFSGWLLADLVGGVCFVEDAEFGCDFILMTGVFD
jgi:hypothetical protein